jgi:hypothetical protein
VEAKDKEKAVLTVVHLGDISLEEYGKRTAKKGPSLTCEKQDCSLVTTTSGGRARPLILLVFSTPKDAQKCALSLGNQEPLNFVADADVRESVSVSEYLK